MNPRAGHACTISDCPRRHAQVVIVAVVAGFALCASALSGASSLTAALLLLSLVLLPMAFKPAPAAAPANGAKPRPAPRASEQALHQPCISDILDSLGDDYLLLHDIRSPDGHSDHVVISRNYGIFLIERLDLAEAVAEPDNLALRTGVKIARQHADWLAQRLHCAFGPVPSVTPLVLSKRRKNSLSASYAVTNLEDLAETVREQGLPLPAKLWDARESIARQLN